MAIITVTKKAMYNITNESQSAVSQEKMTSLSLMIRRQVQRLGQTGMVEVYEKDFQNRILVEIKETYKTSDSIHEGFPIIIDSSEEVLLSQNLERFVGNTSDFFDTMGDIISPGEFAFQSNGENHWCTFTYIEEWGWYIISIVPYSEKYHTVNELMGIIIPTILGMTALIIFVLMALFRRNLKPIIELNRSAWLIAE